MQAKYIKLVLLLFPVLGMISCSESDDTPEEFPDWKNYNEMFVKNLATDSVGNGWERILNYSYPPVMDGTMSSVYNASDYIYVKRLRNGNGTQKPIYTDTVAVHYQGRLLPSTTYSNGYIFDQSWLKGTQLDESINPPVKMAVNGVVDGFATALQNMVVGDRWLVYMPYQLGYNVRPVGYNSISSGIVGTEYSTLLFDITVSKIIPRK